MYVKDSLNLQAFGLLPKCNDRCENGQIVKLGLGQNFMDLLDLFFDNVRRKSWCAIYFHGKDLPVFYYKNRIL